MSTTTRFHRITLNGRAREILAEELSYEEIARLAYPGPDRLPLLTVTVGYRRDSTHRNRSPVPGESVPCEEGMVINAAYTGSALRGTIAGMFIPPSPPSPRTGTQIAQSLPKGPGRAREQAILECFLRGEVPDALRGELKEIPLVSETLTGSVYALPTVLTLGTDADPFRCPMSAPTAQAVADAWGASLITPKISDAIWKAAESKEAPIPMDLWKDGAAMMATAGFQQHNTLIQSARKGLPLGVLSAGEKKDVVLTPKLLSRPNNVAIYGWHKLSGVPIQGLNPSSHELSYVDYSHGIRLVDLGVKVGDETRLFSDVLADPAASALLSSEGPSTFSRYPVLPRAPQGGSPSGKAFSQPPQGPISQGSGKVSKPEEKTSSGAGGLLFFGALFGGFLLLRR